MIYFSEHILTVRDRDCSVVEQKKRARTMIRFPGIFRVHAGVSPKSTSFLGRGKEFTRSVMTLNHTQTSFHVNDGVIFFITRAGRHRVLK